MEHAYDGSCIIFDRPSQTVKLVFQIIYLILQKRTDISTAQLVFWLQNYIIWNKNWLWKRCRINCIWPRRQYSNVLLYVNCATVKFNILCNKLGWSKGSVFKSWWKVTLNYHLNFVDTYFNNYFDELWEQ